jgi:hypothetical protein
LIIPAKKLIVVLWMGGICGEKPSRERQPA